MKSIFVYNSKTKINAKTINKRILENGSTTDFKVNEIARISVIFHSKINKKRLLFNILLFL